MSASRTGLASLGRPLTGLRRDPPPEHLSFLLLAALNVLFLLLGARFGIANFPTSLLALPVLLGGLLLGVRRQLQLVVVTGLCLLGQALVSLPDLRPGGIVVVAVTAVVAQEFARSRRETGLDGLAGETVLVELRERLETQGSLPRLPPGWQADAVVLPAGGVPFAGDFVVSSLTGVTLELVVADVSGKGVEAGTRALLLSGALGGLLGVDPRSFMASANAYLLRQRWDEGFATAVHVAVDTRTGAYAVTAAGHPPVIRYDAGSGRWSLVEAEGTVLGLLESMVYAPMTGTLDRGDALLMYTDGLIEIPGRDLSYGIDKLLGEAERAAANGFRGGAAELVGRVAGDSSDDRGLVMLWRQP